MRNEYGLTPKQQKLADEYLIDLNITQAAIRCGYSIHTAKQIGSKILTSLDAANYIANQLKIIQNSKIATAREVEEYLTKAIRGELKEDVVVFSKDDSYIVTKGLAGREMIKAAELMAKRHSLLTDKIDLSVQGTIIIDASDDMQDT
jgi:phage terminase small subunit